MNLGRSRRRDHPAATPVICGREPAPHGEP
jgi:hypothetical protein